jgi:GT2 family glycosyltransferase
MASGELVLFCDDDMLLAPSHLQLHLATRARHGDPIVSGAWEFSPAALAVLQASPFGRYRVVLERGFQRAAGGQRLAGDDACAAMPLLGAANLALRRELFWDIGGFDERFPVAGAEDQDFSLRARAAGAQLLLNGEIRCLHNDDHLTLRAYCAREERSAMTMPFLARKYPGELGEIPYVRENRPVQPGDPLALRVKKRIKELAARRPLLELTHRVIGLLERAGAPERLLGRCYSSLLGVYLFRGFRRTWRT